MAIIKAGNSRRKAGSIKLESGEVIDYYEPTMGDAYVEMGFMQYYLWTLSMLCRLDRCAAELIQFMALNMNDDNIIDFTKRLKEVFIEQMKDDKGSPRYAIRTVDNALGQLKKKNLVRDIARGSFLVNPKYFFKSKPEKRIEMVKLQLSFEEKKGMSIQVEASKI